MDSKAVNRRIKAEVWPLLRDAGFTRFSSRTAWRHRERQVDVVNFQSFNSYNASVLGCTTYSFSVNLGCYLLEVPESFPSVKDIGGTPLPEEYQCHFRGRLAKQLRQPEFPDKQIWFVDAEGAYIAAALHDVRMKLSRDALPWFDRLSDRGEALRILREDEEIMGQLWGFGRQGSPTRLYLTGYVALAAGRHDIAREALQAAASKPSFSQIAERLRTDGAARA